MLASDSRSRAACWLPASGHPAMVEPLRLGNHILIAASAQIGPGGHGHSIQGRVDSKLLLFTRARPLSAPSDSGVRHALIVVPVAAAYRESSSPPFAASDPASTKTRQTYKENPP